MPADSFKMICVRNTQFPEFSVLTEVKMAQRLVADHEERCWRFKESITEIQFSMDGQSVKTDKGTMQ